MAALAFPDNHCIISTNILSRASRWATPLSHHLPPLPSPWAITRSLPVCANKAETTPKFWAIVAGEPLPPARRAPVTASGQGGGRRTLRGGPAAMCSSPGGAAAAAFALSTFPAPRRVPSLPIYGAHARSSSAPERLGCSCCCRDGGCTARRGAGGRRGAARGGARGRGGRRGGGPGARRPRRQRASGERGEQPRGARAAAWRGSDARSPAATAAPPRP